MRRVPLSLLAVVLAAAPTLAKKPPRCPDGTWVIVGQRLLTTDPVASPIDAVTIAGRAISIQSGCAPKNGMVKGTKHGTKVRGRWAKCGALKNVVLKALVDTACIGMTGTVKAKGAASMSFNGMSDSVTSTTTVNGTTTTTTTIAGGSTTTTTLPLGACGAADLTALKAAAAGGGTLALQCSGSINLDETLVIDGANVTITGFVSIGRDANAIPRPPQFRLIDVRSGSLTLDGPSLHDGVLVAPSGGSGTPGQAGAEGMLGSDGGPAASGMPGGPAGPATDASAGSDGGSTGGAAMQIAAGATVVLRNCRVQQNIAVGGIGGEGGQGGHGGNGGSGGRGGPGEGTDAGNGGGGLPGGTASPGMNGGAGGDVEGGAIHNDGTLTIEHCRFEVNTAAGGAGGLGAFGGESGGSGGSGGQGGGSSSNAPTGTNGGNGGDGGNGNSGQPGKKGGNGGDGGSGFGGAIYNTGTLTVSDTTFRNNFATGNNAGLGRTGGAGGGGGDGGFGGLEGANDVGNHGGSGGNGGNGKIGGNGGSNGNGGSAIGGAIFSTTQPSLTNVVFQQNGCTAGSGGSNSCAAGDFSCFGAGGTGGPMGSKGRGGLNWPLGDGFAPDGSDGAPGDAGAAGAAGQPGVAADANCHGAGSSCP